MDRLTYEEVQATDWNEFSTEDIYCLIDMGFITRQDIDHYYNNPQWDDVV